MVGVGLVVLGVLRANLDSWLSLAESGYFRPSSSSSSSSSSLN